MTTTLTELEGFQNAVAALQRAFPSLRIHVRLDEHNEHVQASAGIAAQDGMAFGVGFALQSDELHLDVGTTNFRMEWFPCTDPRVVAAFVAAVSGLLCGQYRVVDSAIGGYVVKSELQRATAPGRWKTEAIWASLAALIPWPRRRTIVQNPRREAW